MIAIGYALAVAAAFASVAVRNALIGDAAGGMAAFGDVVLFVGVLGVVSLAPTAALLYRLRRKQRLWRAIAAVAVACALTGPIAAMLFQFGRDAPASSAIAAWAALSVLRILIAPLFVLGFALGSLIATERITRRALYAAATLDLLASAYGAWVWFAPLLMQRAHGG